MTDTIKNLRSRLQTRRGRYPEICDRFGFNYSTLSKFANGQRGARPSFEFVDSLRKALNTLDADAAAETKAEAS